jgi:hypothetical protein
MWGRAADAARATDEGSTTGILGAGAAGAEFRASPRVHDGLKGLRG